MTATSAQNPMWMRASSQNIWKGEYDGNELLLIQTELFTT
jgi:hypothetical protein